MTFEQLIADLKQSSSFFSLSSLRPSDMAAAFADADSQIKSLAARVAKLEAAAKAAHGGDPLIVSGAKPPPGAQAIGNANNAAADQPTGTPYPPAGG